MKWMYERNERSHIPWYHKWNDPVRTNAFKTLFLQIKMDFVYFFQVKKIVVVIIIILLGNLINVSDFLCPIRFLFKEMWKFNTFTKDLTGSRFLIQVGENSCKEPNIAIIKIIHIFESLFPLHFERSSLELSQKITDIYGVIFMTDWLW